MAGHRPERVGRQIVEALAEIIERQAGDPRVRSVTFTHARVTPDLRQVRVFFTVLGDEAAVDAAAEGLARARGYLRREVTARLGLRFSPMIAFTHDETGGRLDRIARLLKDAHGGHDGE